MSCPIYRGWYEEKESENGELPTILEKILPTRRTRRSAFVGTTRGKTLLIPTWRGHANLCGLAMTPTSYISSDVLVFGPRIKIRVDSF